jgi:hypothetical protein
MTAEDRMNERKVERRFPDNLLALILTGCAIAGISALPRIISAQIPDSKPKPGQGGVVKLHGQPYLVVSLPAGTPFQLSGGCVPGRPVLTFTVQVSNKGTLANRVQPPETVVALDDTIFPERWQGQASLPEIPPGQSVSVSIPIAYVASMALSGTHIFRLYVPGDAGKDANIKNPQAVSSRVVFPDGYCAPPNSRPKPQPPLPPNKNPKLVRPGLPF